MSKCDTIKLGLFNNITEIKSDTNGDRQSTKSKLKRFKMEWLKFIRILFTVCCILCRYQQKRHTSNFELERKFHQIQSTHTHRILLAKIIYSIFALLHITQCNVAHLNAKHTTNSFSQQTFEFFPVLIHVLCFHCNIIKLNWLTSYTSIRSRIHRKQTRKVISIVKINIKKGICVSISCKKNFNDLHTFQLFFLSLEYRIL